MRIITLNESKKIIGVKEVRDDYLLQENEIESSVGEIGQIMQQDGTFITPEPTPVDPQPTLEDKINYIYYKEMGVIV